MVEWVEKTELVCRLSRVKNIESVVLMRLWGGAYAVYQQLSEEKRADFACIKDFLYTAFGENMTWARMYFQPAKSRSLVFMPGTVIGELKTLRRAEWHRRRRKERSRKRANFLFNSFGFARTLLGEG